MHTKSSLERLTNEQLAQLVHSTKQGIFRAIDHRDTLGASFHIGVSVLEIFERELRKRGLDPSDEKVYGRDIIGEIIAERLKNNESIQQVRPEVRP
jgi:hypothetical protein